MSRWGRGPPADVVTDEAEAGGAGLLLHRPPERRLSRSRHGVGLIQDDDLEGRTWFPTAGGGTRVGHSEGHASCQSSVTYSGRVPATVS